MPLGSDPCIASSTSEQGNSVRHDHEHFKDGTCLFRTRQRRPRFRNAFCIAFLRRFLSHSDEIYGPMHHKNAYGDQLLRCGKIYFCTNGVHDGLLLGDQVYVESLTIVQLTEKKQGHTWLTITGRRSEEVGHDLSVTAVDRFESEGSEQLGPKKMLASPTYLLNSTSLFGNSITDFGTFVTVSDDLSPQ